MQSTYINTFPDFPDESEVWIYAADRFLSTSEVSLIQEKLNDFAENWKTHGKSLRADAKVLNDVFVVFATDIQVGSASGCSIDTSVRLMKELCKLINVDFFNRLKVIVSVNDHLQHVSFHDLQRYTGNEYADISVKTLGGFRNAFFVQV